MSRFDRLLSSVPVDALAAKVTDWHNPKEDTEPKPGMFQPLAPLDEKGLKRASRWLSKRTGLPKEKCLEILRGQLNTV